MSKYEMVEIIDSGKIIAKEFNRCKEDLKLFSEQTEADLSLSRVDTDWFWGFGSHTVTGEELNRLTSQIQNYLIGFNNINNKIIREFSAIYNTFNALDNEYIKNIMHSIKKSNEAINKANLGLIEAEKRIEDIKETNGRIEITQNNIKVIQDKLQVAQQNIDKNVEIQKKVIEGLSQFKTRIDSYRHLEDIDKIWENLQKLDKELPTIFNEIRDIKSNVEKNEEKLNTIKRFKERLENYRHLEDIDKIWNDLDYLRVIKSKLEIIDNIDKLTNDLEGLKKVNASTELRLKNTYNLIEEKQKKIENLENNLETSQNVNQSLSKKLNISYFLGGGALILTLFNTFYLFLRG